MPKLEDRCWSCSCSPSMKSKDFSLASRAGETMSTVAGVVSQAFGSLRRLHTASLVRRGVVLFAVGVFLALVLYLLQIKKNVVLFPEEVLDTLLSSSWWIPLGCGTAAGELEGETV